MTGVGYLVFIPQNNYRGKSISFEQFCDLVIIGMAGLSDTVMLAGEPYILDGMVNYKIVSDRLGLVYEPDWLEGFGHEHRDERIDDRSESEHQRHDVGGFAVELESQNDP